MTDPTTPDSDQRFGSTVEDIYESTFVAEPNSRSVPLVEEVEVDDREWLSEFPRRYQLIGTQFDDEFNVGARLLNAETSRPSLMPDRGVRLHRRASDGGTRPGERTRADHEHRLGGGRPLHDRAGERR